MTKLVHAAGGVIIDPVRRSRVLVVHRPRYDDWSFPKGKLHEGESASDCAIREVREETGLHCDLLEELTPVHYVTRNGNLKTVRYWLMTPRSGAFAVNNEVDAVSWLKRTQALALLTHDFDHSVLVESQRRVKEVHRAEKRAAKRAAKLAAVSLDR